MAAAVGCVYTPTASLGVRAPIGGNTNIQPSAVVGGGVMAADGNKMLEMSLDFDQTEDVNGPLTISSDNLTLRVNAGIKKWPWIFKAGVWHRWENPTMETPEGTSGLPQQSLGGLGIGVGIEAGPVDIEVGVQKSMWGDSHPDAPTGAYGLSATYRF